MVYSNLPFNVSPKVAYTVLTFVATSLLGRYAVELPAGVVEALPALIAGLVGYVAPVGDVVEDFGSPSDDLLPALPGDA